MADIAALQKRFGIAGIELQRHVDIFCGEVDLMGLPQGAGPVDIDFGPCGIDRGGGVQIVEGLAEIARSGVGPRPIDMDIAGGRRLGGDIFEGPIGSGDRRAENCWR